MTARDRSVIRELLAATAMVRAAGRSIADRKLEPAEWQALACVWLQPASPASFVADELGVAPGAARNALTSLAESGLVDVARDPTEGRRAIYSCTVDGNEVIADLLAALRRAQ